MHTSLKSPLRRAILTGTILPVALLATSHAADVFWDGSQTPFTLNVNPTYGEGLREGFANAADDETTLATANPGPNNGFGFGISSNLRMGQSTLVDAFSGWQDNRTWIYAGEIFTGPNGIISLAANNDDNDFFRIGGAIVLNDNGWDTPQGRVVTGLTPNSWVPFEYRVGNGGGGAGPSGANNNGGVGWTQSIGVVMSHNNEASSLAVANYVGGPDDLGQPAEVMNGTPTLFRFLISAGAGGDDVRLTASSVVTMTGSGTTVQQNSLLFQAGDTPVTLTFNNSDAVQRTLGANSVSLGSADNAMTTIAGTGHVRLGTVQDGNFTGIVVIKNGGTGDLVFAGSANDMNGTTLRAIDGRISIEGNGTNPVSSLANAIELNSDDAILRFGGTGPNTTPTTFNTSILVNESGTLEHVSNRTDTVTGSVTILTNKILNADLAAGRLRVSGSVFGGSINKVGAGDLVLGGSTVLDSVTVSGGRLTLAGDTNLSTSPIIVAGSGGTLALTGVGVTYAFPTPLLVPNGGTLEVYPQAIGNFATTLSGGTLVLDGQHGLLGEFFGVAPVATPIAAGGGVNFLATWGPETLNQGAGSAGANVGGSGDLTLFQNAFAALGGPAITANSSSNGVENFDFSNNNYGNGIPYGAYGFNNNDNIQARWTGKFFAPLAGLYGFNTISDDGSAIFVDGISVAYNNRFQGAVDRGGSIFLEAGLHDIIMGHYEGGGGAGFQARVTMPGGTNQLLSNASLFPDANPAAFINPITITANSTIQTSFFAATASEITLQPGLQLTTTGFELTVASLKLLTDGAYTINTSGADNVFTASVLDDGVVDAAITLNKTGAGLFVLDNTTTAQLANAASVINLNQGTLGILLQSGGLSPTGAATINFSGGGVVLSSKGGDQTYPLPASFGGTNPALEARQIGSGVAGPVNLTLGGNLNVPTGQTLGLKSADDYTLIVGGTANLSGGAGTVSINGGRINATTDGALGGLNVAFNPIKDVTGTLNFRTSAPSISSLSSAAAGNAQVLLGNGAANSTLTINQSTNTAFNGVILQETGSVGSVVKQGAGTLTLSGAGSTFTGGLTIESGTVVAGGLSLGSGAITLAGGTLAPVPAGLLGEYWDISSGGETGAQAGFAGNLAAFNAYFAIKGAPQVTAQTTTNNRTILKFSTGPGIDGGGVDNATYGDQGFAATNNMAVRFSGTVFAPVDGDYTFKTRSDDGSVLYIDGIRLVDNNFNQGMTTREGTITLSAGPHSISVGMYEGNGESGMEIRYTLPGGVDQFLPNSVLGGLHATNSVLLTASSTIDPLGGAVDLGVLTSAPALTLNALAGNVGFTGTNLPSAGTYVFNKTGAGVLSLGAITDSAAAVTIRKTGDGDLLLGAPLAPQLTNTNSVLQVDAGGLIAVTDGVNSPLGSAAVQLAANTAITFSSSVAGPVSFQTPLQLMGAATVAAGNRGFGALDNVEVTVGSALVIGANTLTLRTTNGYSLSLNAITGTGTLAMVEGTANLNAPATVGAVTVSGTPLAGNTYGATLSATESLTATTASVQAGGVLRHGGVGTYSVSGGTTVAANAEFQTNGGTIASTVMLNGGLLRAQSGITDLGNDGLSITQKSSTANALRGVLHLTGAEGQPSAIDPQFDAGILTTRLRKPESMVSLTSAVNIPDDAASDAAFGTLFGSPSLAGQRFTAGFFGTFTAPQDGVYSFQLGRVDDMSGFWVDLNNNGIFETNGSAGTEAFSNRACCGDGPIGTATLVAGTSYNVAFAVEDTNGNSGLIAQFLRPSDPGPVLIDINPGALDQAGLWSSADPNTGGHLVVEGSAELRTGRINNALTVALTGGDAKLRVSNTSVVADAVEAITAIMPAGLIATLELGANNTVNANNLSVAPDSTLVKTGEGVLNAAHQSLGLNAILRVEDGLVNLNGLTNAFSGNVAGNANMGGIVINDGGTVNVNGAISGAVMVNSGGRLGGTGTVGATTISAGGIFAPGTSPGTLTTGTLLLDPSANLVFELSIAGALTGNDKGVVNGDLTLDGLLQIIQLAGFAEGTYPLFTYTGTLLDNGLQLEAAFLNTWMGSSIDVSSTPNTVNLVVVPEPGAFAALLGGLGLLTGLRRFRRS